MKLSLDECFEFINGGAWNESEYSETGIHVVKVTNLINGSVELRRDNYLPLNKYEKYKRHKLSEGDVVIATVGSHPTQQGSVVGRTSRIPKEFEGSFLNQNCVCLKNKLPDQVNTRYFYYVTRTILFKGYIEGRAKGSANQVRMALGDLKKFTHDFPEIEIQQKIAATLATYDDLIGNNKLRIALLEDMAEDIYREWFVRFRFPCYQKSEFEKGYPKDWENDYAYKFFEHVKGKSYKSDEITDSDDESMPFVTLKSFNRGGGYRADGLKAYSGKYRDEQVVHEGDVVMAVTDMTQNREVVGRVARIPDLGDKGAVISLDVIKLVPKTISSTYLYSYMKYSGFGHFIKAFANGANVLHLKPDLVTNQKIVVPPEELRNKFEDIVNPIHEQIGYLTKEIDNLETTKQSLLPRLISGKLLVEDLDIKFPPSILETKTVV
ncbi:restriction endonuclease subunit S [Pseudoalteromonas neustonica]|uniref:Restriction endonuclease subunit S n=1 Tax=Pseudoalteromonas neustonica TaxID=1840331 RepID=A0ABU9U6C2_9GAMM